MTNGEKYKTAEERNAAFDEFCGRHDKFCTDCPIASHDTHHCDKFKWLDLEVEEEKPMPCPFCGSECSAVDSAELPFIQCGNSDCLYSGRVATTTAEAIAAHNRICKAVAAYKESEVK